MAADYAAAVEMVRVSGQQGVPVITVDGQVVVGFDQPRLMQLLRQARPRLGAAIADAATQRKKHPASPGSGALVGRVQPGSAAERAGLQPGDVITALAGQAVTGADDLQRLVSQLTPGREISLTYVRQGQQRHALVNL